MRSLHSRRDVLKGAAAIAGAAAVVHAAPPGRAHAQARSSRGGYAPRGDPMSRRGWALHVIASDELVHDPPVYDGRGVLPHDLGRPAVGTNTSPPRIRAGAA
jgi:hypothetical protein